MLNDRPIAWLIKDPTAGFMSTETCKISCRNAAERKFANEAHALVSLDSRVRYDSPEETKS